MKANPEGEILRLKDVGEVELGPQFFDIYSDINGHPAASIVLKQAPGSNAAEVIEEIKTELEQIKKESFPPGMDYEFAYDVSKFLDASIEKVLHTLLEAFILVSLVVYMFLGDLRSTLIPILAVPVSLIGTFFVLQLMGLSINLITLFAMVLAIGVVVDDAIVVVEAVHAKMAAEALIALSGDHGGASRDLRRDHRHHPGDDGRLRSGDFHSRAGRHLLPPVRHHDGHVHHSLRSGGPDADARALCDDSQAPHPHPTPTTTPARDDNTRHRPQHERREKAARTRSNLLFALGGLVVLGHSLIWRINCGGRSASCLFVLPFVRRAFDRAVEKVTGGYAGILRRIVTRRTLTMAVVGGFAAGIVCCQHEAPDGFYPGRGPGHHLRRPPDASGLDARVHQRQVPGTGGDRQGGRRSHLRHLVGRLRGSDRGPRLERGNLYHQPEKLVRPQADRTPDH